MNRLLDPALDTEALALLALRAEQARARPDQTSEEKTLPVAEFSVGPDRYAIALESLRAVLPLRIVTPVPMSPAHVIGILRFRSQFVTAVSLVGLLGVRGWREDHAVLLVVEVGPERLVAIDCERVPDIGALPVKAIEQARSRAQGPLVEVTCEGLKQVQLLDLGQLLQQKMEGAHGR